MTTNEFWDVIAQGQKSVQKTTEMPGWFEAYLRPKPTAYLAGYASKYFELCCLAYDLRLWAAASIMMKFCSDDKFDDFRGWLIAKGKDVFERALKDPDTLADVDMDGDDGVAKLFHMGFVAEGVYRERAGDMADITDIISLPELVLLNQDAWDRDRKKLPQLFPRLCARYGCQP